MEDADNDDDKPRHHSTSNHTKKHLQNLLQNEQNAALYKARQDAAQIIIISLREILKKSHLLRCKMVLRYVCFFAAYSVVFNTKCTSLFL